jgi:hypothetical protein
MLDDLRMPNPIDGHLLNLPILIILIPPKGIDLLPSIGLHLSPAAIAKHPSKVVSIGQDQLDDHLQFCIVSNDEQNYTSVAACSCVRLSHHDVHIDENIGQYRIPKQPT